jgi:hypothetical protein
MEIEYSTNALRIFGRLGGYEEIDPPRRDKDENA